MVLSTGQPVGDAQLQALISQINETRALAIYAIYPTKTPPSETFDLISVYVMHDNTILVGVNESGILWQVSSDARGGAIIDWGNISEQFTNVESVDVRSFGTIVRRAAVVITHPDYVLGFAQTGGTSQDLTIIYDWVEHPFPNKIEALLHGELTGEVTQVDLERAAGDDYFQPSVFRQLGGVQ